MNENQPKESSLVDTTDCLEGVGVFRGWKNFLFVMIKKTYQVLPKKGILALNINDVKIKNKKYPLVKDSIEFAKHIGFVFDETLYMKFSGFGKGLKKTKHEPILIFVK